MACGLARSEPLFQTDRSRNRSRICVSVHDDLALGQVTKTYVHLRPSENGVESYPTRLSVAAERCYYQGEHVVGLSHALPVSDGGALLVTRRHVASWFEATGEERRELPEVVEAAKAATPRRSIHPTATHSKINIGRAAWG